MLSVGLLIFFRNKCCQFWPFLFQNLKSSSVDQQHALLEYLPEDECFVLQDLNSVHGTYVNDCRVENVSIRLCAGDIIRFGKSSIKHELVIEQQQRVSDFTRHDNMIPLYFFSKCINFTLNHHKT